jgi:hypothetical protein
MSELKLFNRVYEDLKRRRQKILDGKINCIPCSFNRFSEEWPGVEQSKYFLITAQQKVGKTQFADKMFLFDPFFYAFNHPEIIRLKIIYFSLEISAEEKYKQFICYLLFMLSRGRIRVSQRDLNSTIKDSPLSEEILTILESDEYKKYFKFFEEHIDIISHVRNPTGMHEHVKNYAKEHGHWEYKEIDWKEIDGSITKKKVKDYYIPNDPDEYVIIMTDHIGLITTESEAGRSMNLHESIAKLSSKYMISWRDDYKYINVAIQQQALSGESTENVKLGKLKPSGADLADNKATSRDCNIMFGIFSPIRHDLQSYMGYDITKFRDNIRFMEIMIAREGGNNSTAPLFFDGACNFIKELPLPNDSIGIAKVYSMLDSIRQPKKVSMFLFKNNDELKEEEISYRKSYRNFWNVWRGKNNKYHN